MASCPHLRQELALCSLWTDSGEVPARVTLATGRIRVWLSCHPNNQIDPACFDQGYAQAMTGLESGSLWGAVCHHGCPTGAG